MELGMQIVKIRTVNGPNIFHSCPVIVMQLNLESYTEISSADLPNFKERLLQFLPGLQEHHCSPGRPGGFLERLDRGTYFAHIVEHVALEMSELAGIPVFYGKSVYAGKEGHYNVVVRFKNEDGMKILLQEAVSLVTALYEGQNKFDLQYGIERAKRAASRSALGPSTKAIVDAAKARGIPWRRIGKESLIQFGYGKNIRRIQAGVTDKTPLIAADMVQDKDFTKTILEEANVPYPESRVVRDIQELEDALQEIDGPWALKPLDGNHGNGVVLNLTNLEEAIKAYEIAKEFCDYILVERMCTGRDYRILVIGGRLVAAAERKPAHVVGDGVLSVAALIDKTNLDPRRGEGHAAVLTKIEIDELLIECLRKNHFTLESIPQAGETVWLRETANLSTGGTAADVTDIVHPQIRALCERIARFTGLDICGIDFIHSDISKPLERGSGVIEVNAGPGLRMHIAPTEGKGRDVGGEIIDMLYPPGTNSRIPIVAITGTNGKTTTTRLTGHLFASQTRKVVGMTTSDGVSIGKECVSQGDTTGPVSAQLVLSDPSVEIAVLETARGGLMRGGLAYDWSDVGIITNLKPDHIGQDGIEDIEDIIRVKSLVAERVREGGTLVLRR
jgi:cyanophycin synthetase